VRSDKPPQPISADGVWAEAPATSATSSAAADSAPPPTFAPSPLPPVGISVTGKGKVTQIDAAAATDGTAAEAGLYRNTYYYFPEEPTTPESGDTRQLFDAQCQAIRTVSQDFHDKLCVQGSGRLATGETVSFAKRNCECAAECPRTGQKICYELLDKGRFPWGRGANGKAITPLRTVAVDSDTIPLGTVLYIPELDGLRDLAGKAHDGCFVAEDRGSKVKGRQVDIFVGLLEAADAWNRAVPSNRGVHVILNASRCATPAPAAPPTPKAPPRKKPR
jgi:3D (Asp-Asp-Asp) domain-containing protein